MGSEAKCLALVNGGDSNEENQTEGSNNWYDIEMLRTSVGYSESAFQRLIGCLHARFPAFKPFPLKEALHKLSTSFPLHQITSRFYAESELPNDPIKRAFLQRLDSL
eukprot:2372671-Amphidinium_carterae.1